MKVKYGKYEYQKEHLPKSGDFDDCLYKVKNTESGKNFDYRMNMSASSLATSTGLPTDVQLAVATKGDNLVKKWLDEEKEEKIQVRITTVGIESKSLDTDQEWFDWKDFAALASQSDFEEYFKIYLNIFKKILKPRYGIEAKAYVSDTHGSLLYLKIRPGKYLLEYQLIKGKRIGSILAKIPQKGFSGNLEKVIFGGVNKVVEEDKIIYIKGENTKDVWSKQLAEKEAKEETDMIIKSLSKKRPEL